MNESTNTQRFRRNWNIKKSLYSFIKRFLDILLSAIGIIVSWPIMIIIAIGIKVDSKGPIIFCQQRTGKYGRSFNVWKFRTMISSNNVRDFSKDDQRTKIGVFLRKTSLDELPQLFNILIGRMSFIGPRPWIPEYYDNMNEEQKHRVDVTPGLTGLAQVNGRNNISVIEKIKYDLEYIDNYGLVMDLKIIFLTIKIVFSREGADAGKFTIQNELEELRNYRDNYMKKAPKVSNDTSANEMQYI